MSDKIDLIYDLLKSDREESVEFRKEVREAQKATYDNISKLQVDTAERLSKIEALDAVQNKQLEEHMRRTDILEKLHSDNSSRIEKLEKPRDVIITIGKWIVAAGAVIAAIAGVKELFK